MGIASLLVIFCCLGVVVYWYASNEAQSADGETGLFALAPRAGTATHAAHGAIAGSHGAYVVKARGRRPNYAGAGETPVERLAAAEASVAMRRSSYRPADTGRRRYRMITEAAPSAANVN
ncbi:MAG: hypothetical protein GC152_01280 [Alphaproteobacteria bacterium]|nr:hypothetical protein [Alphaproteobacteria bacterium]